MDKEELRKVYNWNRIPTEGNSNIVLMIIESPDGGLSLENRRLVVWFQNPSETDLVENDIRWESDLTDFHIKTQLTLWFSGLEGFMDHMDIFNHNQNKTEIIRIKTKEDYMSFSP